MYCCIPSFPADGEDWLGWWTLVTVWIDFSAHLPCSLAALLLLELCCEGVGSLIKLSPRLNRGFFYLNLDFQICYLVCTPILFRKLFQCIH
jgi:hypothetical protein